MKVLTKQGLYLSLLLAVFFITACSSAFENRLETATLKAQTGDMSPQLLRTDPFHLYSFQSLSPANRAKQAFTSEKQYRARVFIEGDGMTWLTRNRVSPDPTPINPTMLDIAAADCSVNRIYLARPCHYVDLDTQPLCSPLFWVAKLYNEDVVESYMEALDHFKEKYRIEEFELVGYSGGATVAAQIAAKRDDVILFMTVAGNLDTQAFVGYHEITPYERHQNPKDAAPQITMPQIHFIGSEDEIIKDFMVKNFVRALPSRDQARIIEIEGMGHSDDWSRVWQNRVSCPNT